VCTLSLVSVSAVDNHLVVRRSGFLDLCTMTGCS